MKKKRMSGFVSIAAFLGLLIFSGCATTTPKPIFTQEISPGHLVAASDSMKALVGAANNIAITDLEKARISRVIEEKIATKKVLNAKNGDSKNYEVNVTLTRYDKGNAFARAMLAGLGQIHIEGQVKLFEMPDKKKVGEFSIQKTFAWGGVYGAATSIEDIEKTFADSIAAAVTGQSDDAAK